ncbi:MAG: metalloregulator ArsR/SmtB family transcription factor [Victivallales bacterium]|nr:metalloregulator ArsR/SmtB family transcription factor [Victivallales bacterium]
MKKVNMAVFEAKARILKALAHPTRIFVVEELAKGERCVCQLVEPVGADFSTVSRHLALLRDAGIVEDEKRGQQVFYRLRTPCIISFLGCITNIIKNKLEEEKRLFME